MTTPSRGIAIGATLISPDGETFKVTALGGSPPTFTMANVHDHTYLNILTSEVQTGDWIPCDAPPETATPFAGDGVLAHVHDDRERSQIRKLADALDRLIHGCPPDCDDHSSPSSCFSTNRLRREQDKQMLEELRGTSIDPGSLRSLERKRSRYSKQGIQGLVSPSHLKVKDRLANADPVLIDALEGVVQASIGDSTKSKRTLIGHAVFEYQQRIPDADIPNPSTLYKYFDIVSAGRYVNGEAKTRSSIQQPDGHFAVSVATRPGQVMEIDATKLDVLARPDDGGDKYRPTFTLMMDAATRTFAGWLFTPGACSAADTSRLLARALVPLPARPGWEESARIGHYLGPLADVVSVDDRLRDAMGLPVIMPETIVIDHGKEFDNATFRSSCARLGISIKYARRYTGQDKPMVERHFQSVSTMFCQDLPSYVGRNAAHRGDTRRIDAAEALTIGEMDDLFSYWYVHHWIDRPHDGLRSPLNPARELSPRQAYETAIGHMGYAPMPYPADVFISLLPAKERTLGRQGVQNEYCLYDSKALQEFRQTDARRLDQTDFRVHIDPANYGVAYVYNPITEEYITATWTQAGRIQQPFSREMWSLARKAVAHHGIKADSYAGQRAIAEELERIMARREVSGKEAAAARRVVARQGTPAEPQPSDPPRPPKPKPGPAWDGSQILSVDEHERTRA